MPSALVIESIMPTRICAADTPLTKTFPGEAAAWLKALAGSRVPQPASAPSMSSATAVRRAFVTPALATSLPFPVAAPAMRYDVRAPAEWTLRNAGRRIEPVPNTATDDTNTQNETRSAAGAPEGLDVDVFDVIVIGAGPVGENVADRTRAAGLTTAVVESELVGGECSDSACIPSKALLRPVAALSDARAVPGAGEAVSGGLDAAAVLARRDWFVGNWEDDGQAGWLDSIGAVLVRGHGRLAGVKRVDVETPDGTVRRLAARHAVAVATGTGALVPDLPGVAEAKPWTSREATSAH